MGAFIEDKGVEETFLPRNPPGPDLALQDTLRPCALEKWDILMCGVSQKFYIFLIRLKP